MQNKVNLLQDVAPEIIRACLKKCPKKTIEKGDILLTPQKYNEYVYIVMSGKLSVSLTPKNINNLGIIEKGECVGEISILDNLKPSAYVIAMEESTVLILSQKIVWELIDSSHAIAKNLLSVLGSRVRYGHGIISENVETQKKLQRDAMIDTLTGLYNRRWTDEVLSQQMTICQKENTPLSLVILDIDHFKSFNDNFGHLVGDLVLKEISTSMLKNLRDSDTLGRFGGEEFIIILPDTELPQSFSIADRIRIAISELRLVDDKKNALPTITVSLGISQLTTKDNEVSLIKKADDALYKAKETGRNRVETL